MTALGGSFLDATDPTQLQKAVSFDFSNAPNDQANDLSEPLGGVRYFAGGPSGLGAQPEVSCVSVIAAIFQPAAVFRRLKESMPQWLNLPLR